MKILNRKDIDASWAFLETTARPLEMARFRHAFQEAPAERVLDALGEFQNDDGGFGHALEPDLRAPESSVLCTSIAFQIVRTLAAPPEHAIVSSAIEFLLSNFNRERCSWRIIPEAAENSPRAPWWYQKGRHEQFEGFSLNPTAEILGYLLDHRQQVPDDVINVVLDRVVSELRSLEEIEMHDLLCCLRLLQTAALPPEHQGQIQAKLDELIRATIALTATEWQGYSLRPLQVVSSPDSPFMSGLEESVAANLDYEIASQNEDGSWTPTWSWDDTFPDEREVAQKEWAGVLTLEKLLTLKRFGRIRTAG